MSHMKRSEVIEALHLMRAVLEWGRGMTPENDKDRAYKDAVVAKAEARHDELCDILEYYDHE